MTTSSTTPAAPLASEYVRGLILDGIDPEVAVRLYLQRRKHLNDDIPGKFQPVHYDYLHIDEHGHRLSPSEIARNYAWAWVSQVQAEISSTLVGVEVVEGEGPINSPKDPPGEPIPLQKLVSSDDSDPSLVTWIRETSLPIPGPGDDRRFEQVWGALEREVHFLTLKVKDTIPRDEAQQICRVALFRAMRFGDFQGRATFRTYATKAMGHALLDEVKHRSRTDARRAKYDPTNEAHDVGTRWTRDPTDGWIEWAIMRDGLLGLPRSQAQAIVGALFGVADDQLGAPASVRQRRSRGLKALRQAAA